jgi:prepilin-type N-terminal cleavage/methylation domain-containing protein
MRRVDERGMGLIEVAIVLVVIAIAGFLFARYFGSTATTVEKLQQEKPLAHTRLAADRATLGALAGAVRTYQAQHEKWPADKATALGLLAGPPRFQCAGNDIEYDPATGAVRLLVDDAARC